MLLAINWRYWQAGKNSRMRNKVQGHLMQASLIEIHQVFPKKVEYFSNRIVHITYEGIYYFSWENKYPVKARKLAHNGGVSNLVYNQIDIDLGYCGVESVVVVPGVISILAKSQAARWRNMSQVIVFLPYLPNRHTSWRAVGCVYYCVTHFHAIHTSK